MDIFAVACRHPCSITVKGSSRRLQTVQVGARWFSVVTLRCVSPYVYLGWWRIALFRIQTAKRRRSVMLWSVSNTQGTLFEDIFAVCFSVLALKRFLRSDFSWTTSQLTSWGCSGYFLMPVFHFSWKYLFLLFFVIRYDYSPIVLCMLPWSGMVASFSFSCCLGFFRCCHIRADIFRVFITDSVQLMRVEESEAASAGGTPWCPLL